MASPARAEPGPSMNDAVKHAPGRSFFTLCCRPACVSDHFWPLAKIMLCPAFLARSGFYLGCVLGLCPQLVSCGPFWVALALIWAVSSACVLSLFPAGLSGWFWPLFGLCPHPASSACLVAFLGRSGCVLSLCPQLVSCGHFCVALALIWAVSSACVLSLCLAGLSGSL